MMRDRSAANAGRLCRAGLLHAGCGTPSGFDADWIARPIVRVLLFVALGIAYLAPGIIGHDPWKQDEAYTFGIIRHMLDSGDWIVPANTGTPFLEKPPLYDWVAVAFALFIWRALLTVGFPVGPLAVVAIAGGVLRGWRNPSIALPVAFAAIGLIVLHFAATSRQLYILPFIGPLSLIAARSVERMPARVHVAWDYASRGLFGACAVLVWCVWLAMTHDTLPRDIFRWLGGWLPLDWTIPLQPAAICAAFALSVGWLAALLLLRGAGPWRGALSWASGVVLAWGLVYTLLLPWLDVAKSYRSVFDDLKIQLAREWRAGDCIASPGLGESEAPMLDYFAGLRYVPMDEPRARACRWLVVQGMRGAVPDPGASWAPFWHGARPGDTREALVVYRAVNGEWPSAGSNLPERR
ncbi:ArnT family glycosyltransferase [Burkholderia cepacia]